MAHRRIAGAMAGPATRTLERIPGGAHWSSSVVALGLVGLVVGVVEIHFADFEHGTHLLVLLAVVVGIAIVRGPRLAAPGLLLGGVGAGVISSQVQEPPGHADAVLQLAMYFLVGGALILMVTGARRMARHSVHVPAAAFATLPLAHAEPLTEREREVLRLAARGISVDAMAGVLFLSPNTVKTHLTHAYAKVGARGRSDAIRRAIHLGELTVDDICPHLSMSQQKRLDEDP